MTNEITIKITGEAGQGMQTVGMALCKLFKNAGLHIFASQDYMSRVRGGNNSFQVRVGGSALHTLRRRSDIVVALDKESVALHRAEMAPEGVLVLDKTKFGVQENDPAFFDVGFYELAQRIAGTELAINSVALGIVCGLMRMDLKAVRETVGDAFTGKSAELIQKNQEAAAAGYEAGKENFKKDCFVVKPQGQAGALVLNGNDAIALGAIKAGCKFYSAYPMTPSTSIMNVIAHYAPDYNIVVEQAEDEIAAVNMAIGASFAGVRAMTGTSGGGFALMVEGVSLAGMTETPVVIVDAQRPAPATGFPTRTEQADLEFVLHAGHGEFARALFTPGTIEEAFFLTIKAFDLAEKYQIPVFILTDQHLADCYEDVVPFDANKVSVKRHIISKQDSAGITAYKRYQLTESGISPRAVPSWIKDVMYVDSDEHTEEGHITESAEVRTKMVEKRLYKKMAGLSAEVEKPVAYNEQGAEILLLGFGSTCGVVKEAVDVLRKEKKIGCVHIPQVWPFPADEISRLMNAAGRTITVENNATGQLARLIRRETGKAVDSSILKYDGRPFNLDDLIARLKEVTHG